MSVVTDYLDVLRHKLLHVADLERIAELEDTVAILEATSSPTGAIIAYYGLLAPDGWLLCDGSAIPGEYTALIALVGPNTPNLKGKVIVSLSAAESEFNTLGEIGGSKTHTLISAEMPTHGHVQSAHGHTQNSHNHVQDAHGHTQTGHNHTLPEGRDGTLVNPGSFIKAGWSNSSGTATANTGGTGGATPSIQATTPTNQGATATNQTTVATNQDAGGSGAHNNLQPYIAIPYIIKT